MREKMIIKSAWGILLFVFSVKSQSHSDLLFQCQFNKTIASCGFTFDNVGGAGSSWMRLRDGTPACLIGNFTSEFKCAGLKSPSISQLADGLGPACLQVDYINVYHAAEMQVSLFNSSSSYPYASLSFPSSASSSGFGSVELPETSYTQLSFELSVNPDNIVPVEFYFTTITLFRCPTKSTASAATTTPETTTSMPCDLKTEETCFTYFNEPMSHQKAQETCMSLQGKLPELRTESIKNLLMSQVDSKRLKMWIGANDRDEGGSFVWESDNEKLDVPNSWWIRGEPNNWRGREDCVMMKPPRGKLNDGNCNMKLTFFCQF